MSDTQERLGDLCRSHFWAEAKAKSPWYCLPWATLFSPLWAILNLNSVSPPNCQLSMSIGSDQILLNSPKPHFNLLFPPYSPKPFTRAANNNKSY